MKYLIVIEKGEKNYSAYSPDIPGCAATGKTVDETISEMQSALEFHFEGMIEGGEKIPMPKSLNFYLEQTNEISDENIRTHRNFRTCFGLKIYVRKNYSL